MRTVQNLGSNLKPKDSPYMTTYSILTTSIFALFGLVIGSFLNVCIWRIPQKISVAKGRSFCPHCKNTLSPLELFPVLSYVFLGGKCKTCKEKISPRYAIVELLTATLFALCGGVFGLMQLEYAVIYALFFAVLIVAAFIDFDTMEVPDTLHIIIFCLGVAKAIISPTLIWQMALGAFIVSVPMLILAVLTKGFGGADIKLMATAGFLLGAKSIVVAFLFAVIIMGAYGAVLIIRKKLFRRNYKSKVPFCPALALGCVLGVFLGEIISNWYLNFIIY